MYRMLIGIAVLGAMLAGATGSYQESIRAWQKHRDDGLRSADGWLTLVGLFWLKPGDNTIGSGDKNDFVLPKNSGPARIGTLHLKGDKVSFTDAKGVSRNLSYDEDKPDKIQLGSISFFVIKRGDKFAVRAKDSNNPARRNFQGMQYFPINPALHFIAKFTPDSKKVPILNILGQTEMQESPGIVEFRYQGQTYHLRPIFEGKTLFFLFKDPTNRTETYQAGRMLNTPLPENGKVDLDFNRSYTPPCTFTPYATCPLPPRENTLPFAVRAGEKRYAQGRQEYGSPTS